MFVQNDLNYLDKKVQNIVNKYAFKPIITDEDKEWWLKFARMMPKAKKPNVIKPMLRVATSRAPLNKGLAGIEQGKRTRQKNKNYLN